MEELTEAFRRLVERSQTPPAQWVLWLVRQAAEQVCDPVTRLELEHALRDSPELLAEMQSALDGIGDVVAEAAAAARTAERMGRLMEQIRAEQAVPEG
jgi:predicted nucleic acid-binding protein